MGSEFGARWRGRRVLVTGADGFIGSHLTEALLARGAHVTALAAYDARDSYRWLDDIEPSALLARRRGNICDARQMRDLTDGHHCVFHLAALIGIPYSYEATTSYVQTNVQGTVNVLDAARDAGVERVVHVSSSEVYGSAQREPMDEEHPLVAQSPYAATKIAAEALAVSYARSLELPVTVVRPFNTFGPRQSERAFIASVVRQCLDPRRETVSAGDLSPRRDYLYVSDTVEALLAASDVDSEELEIYNAGSGVAVTMEAIAQLILRASGCEKPIALDARRVRPARSEVRALVANAHRLREATGWQPTVTLERGIEHAVDWWRARPIETHAPSDAGEYFV
ncbi:MAG: GDP-mannose 4,6-dehydratase [Myxococcales bacterium]|nr:GDP-mannose 4,6-dehydratase [Myxococcales bacterium]